MLRAHTFVGMLDDTQILVQHQTAIYVLDMQQLTEALFHELVRSRCCRLGSSRTLGKALAPQP